MAHFGCRPVLIALVMMVVVVVIAEGHSWIACTDYLDKNGAVWDPSRCRAYARSGYRFTQKATFGLDRGYNYKPRNAQACKERRDDRRTYRPEYPMAVYFKGQEVVIVHPTKNHVADAKCTNRYIPDKGNKIYIGPKDSRTDATFKVFKNGPSIDLGISPTGHKVADALTSTYPKPGYQNAPKFCDHSDKSLATNNFTIPDLAPGRYTFLWAWWFNSPATRFLPDYTSCWEADVVNTRQERDKVLTTRGFSTAAAVDVSKKGSQGNQGTQSTNQGTQSTNQGTQSTNQGTQGTSGNNQGNQGNPGNQGTKKLMKCTCTCEP